MNRADATTKILAAKVAKGVKSADVAKQVGLSKEWVTAACLGQMTLNSEQAALISGGDRVKITMSGKFLPYKTY